MHLDQLRAAWREHLDRPAGTPDVGLVARLVEQFARQFEKDIARRDAAESVVALAVILAFGAAAFYASAPLTKAGCLVVVAGAALIIAMLWRTRRAAPRPTRTLPLDEYLAAERAHVSRQIRLLRSVAWWYVGPILLGANLISWGISPSAAVAAAYTGVTIAFGIFVWWLNQQAVRRDLRPLLDELDRVMRQLPSDPAGHDGT